MQDLGYDVGYETGSGILGNTRAASSQIRPIHTTDQPFPEDWPIVLITASNDHAASEEPLRSEKVHGSIEEQLMTRAGATANPSRQKMLDLSRECLGAVATRRFDHFVETLEEYMEIAASLFASVQCGRYRSREIANRADLAIRAGLRGVGQSSWGPTLFGFADSAGEAEQSARQLTRDLYGSPAMVSITRAANSGAQWRWSAEANE